jgi:hypothetical protein
MKKAIFAALTVLVSYSSIADASVFGRKYEIIPLFS